MRIAFPLFFSLFLACSVTGCASMKAFSPSNNPIVAIRANWNDRVAKTFTDGTYKDKYDAFIESGDEEGAQGERSRQVFVIINGIDSYYDRAIKGRLIAGKATMDTSYDVLLLALTGTASFAGGETPKVLAAVATAIQGTKASIDKNFFQDNSGVMLVIKMDQLRAEVYTEILLSLKQSCKDYPIEAAMRDVIRYYSSGTMKSAVISVVKEAGVQQKKAEDETKSILKSNADLATKKAELEIEKERKALSQ